MSELIYEALRRHWGYTEFRPLQEQIVRSILAGYDVAAILPTGGGKSLCYQLPAVVSGKLALVVSPLIALMQDQVAQLEDMDIPAAAITSAAAWQHQKDALQRARKGSLRLLYLSPERLARADTIEMLKQIPLGFFAIDEAHCISEWGHEFRPEYRQLGALRQAFPDLPIAAFTASATRQVRSDIVHQLALREPRKFIRSFHRSNLRYYVRECDQRTQQRLLLKAIRCYDGENIIIYTGTRASVEETVADLEARGIPAIGYHGQMEAETRRRNQESWTSGETPVMVGTIAFGLGINKGAVRAVIHTMMPKSLEQYYQESGRAGRDGELSDCVLLWQPKDVGLQVHFIEQIQDPDEKQRAWYRYRVMRRFLDSNLCRHRQICQHFGETPKWDKCGNCDVCGSAPEWIESRVSTTTLSIRRAVASGIDPELIDYLREWRRKVAADRKVPAFVILHDASIEALCRELPEDIDDLRGVFGFGEAKIRAFGPGILKALEEFRGGARAERKSRS